MSQLIISKIEHAFATYDSAGKVGDIEYHANIKAVLQVSNDMLISSKDSLKSICHEYKTALKLLTVSNLPIITPTVIMVQICADLIRVLVSIETSITNIKNTLDTYDSGVVRMNLKAVFMYLIGSIAIIKQSLTVYDSDAYVLSSKNILFADIFKIATRSTLEETNIIVISSLSTLIGILSTTINFPIQLVASLYKAL